MKLTIEGSPDEIKKALQAIGTSEEHVKILTLEASNELLERAVESLKRINQMYRDALADAWNVAQPSSGKE